MAKSFPTRTSYGYLRWKTVFAPIIVVAIHHSAENSLQNTKQLPALAKYLNNRGMKITMALGDANDVMGKVQVSGLKDLDTGAESELNKALRAYARKFETLCDSFESLTIKAKAVHKTPKSEKYEVHGKLMDKGKSYSAEAIDLNLILAVDKVLAKLEHELSHIHSRKK